METMRNILKKLSLIEENAFIRRPSYPLNQKGYRAKIPMKVGVALFYLVNAKPLQILTSMRLLQKIDMFMKKFPADRCKCFN